LGYLDAAAPRLDGTAPSADTPIPDNRYPPPLITNKLLSQTVSGEVDGESFRISTEHSEAKIPWTLMFRVVLRRDLVLLYVSAQLFYLVPRSFFADGTSWDAFYRLAAANVTRHPKGELRRNVLADVDRQFSKTSAKLREIRHCCRIQRPKHVLVEGFDPLRQHNLHAIRQQVVLPEEVLLLDTPEQWRIVSFPNGHRSRLTTV
jgi:hypothetical protein